MSLFKMAGRSFCSPGSNSIVPTAAVLPTLEMLTVPVLDARGNHNRRNLFGEIVHIPRILLL